MSEHYETQETLYPHELLYKTRSGVIFSLFAIGFILSIFVNTFVLFFITGDL